MAVARASLTRAQRHPGPCWIIAGPCRELSSTLFQPRRPSKRAGWQPDGERLTVCFHGAFPAESSSRALESGASDPSPALFIGFTDSRTPW
jgi:hypothetical protein